MDSAEETVISPRKQETGFVKLRKILIGLKDD